MSVESVLAEMEEMRAGDVRWRDGRAFSLAYSAGTEVLGLVKAQMVKNAVIVPTGAKGGFVIKASQAAAYPDADDAFWTAFARRTGRELPDGRVAFDYDPAIAHIFEQPPAAAAPDLTPIFQSLAPVSTLVVHGLLSDILLPEGVAAMKTLKPDLEVVQVPRVGHAPTLEEPAAWQAIEGFLARVP